MLISDLDGYFLEDDRNVVFIGSILGIECKYVISKNKIKGFYFMGLNQSIDISNMKRTNDNLKYKLMIVNKSRDINDVFLTDRDMDSLVKKSIIENNLKKYLLL